MSKATSSSKGLASSVSDYLVKPTDAFTIFLQPAAMIMGLPTGPNIETVGVGKQFATLSAAIAASTNGTIIYIDAGTYTNDFATIRNAITIIGVGGMANLVATVAPPNSKGILTVDNNVTIKNLSFSGSAISDANGGNGAGIRYEGGVMLLRNTAFTNNQNGVLAFPVIPSLTLNTITIDHSYFYNNGSGTGYTHNIYVGAVSSLTFTNNVSEAAFTGHELKSRALANTISGNIFADGPAGDGSYDIDLPNGGVDLIQNNIIEKGPNSPNNAFVHFGGEGIPYAGSSLMIRNNTFQNDQSTNAIALLNQTVIQAQITGNVFVRLAADHIASGPAVETGNFDAKGVALADNTLTGVLPGSTLIITDAVAHSVNLDGSSFTAVQGGAGLLTANAINGHVIVIGGAGGLKFSESASSGGNQITTTVKSANVIALSGVGGDTLDSEGQDTITTNLGNLIATINGSAAVADGIGDNQYAVNGSAIITGHGGNPKVTIGAGGSASINGIVSFLQVANNGGNIAIDVMEPDSAGHQIRQSLSITGGATDTQVYRTDAGAPHAVIKTAAGTNGAVIRLGAGTAVVASLGSDMIYAGSGDDTVIVSGAASVYAGTGPLSVFGRGNIAGATIYAAAGTVTLDGDTGNLTYRGGAVANTVIALLSNNILIGGTGLMTVTGGSHETITGGSGGIAYTSPDHGGGNVFTTLTGSVNSLSLSEGNAVTANGIDTIVGGAGNSTYIVNGSATVTSGLGNNQETVNGALTLTSFGQDSVTVNQGGSATVDSQGRGVSVTEVNATATVTAGTAAGAASATVSGGLGVISAGNGGPVTVSTAAGLATGVTIGAGAVQVISYGSDLIHAGSGADTITVRGAGAEIWGGSGSPTTINFADFHGGDVITVHGGAGSLTFNDYSYGRLTFIGGAGAAVINGIGGEGIYSVTGGGGSTTVTGGKGTNFTASMARGSSALVTLTPNAGTILFGAGETTVREAGWEIGGTTYQFASGHGGGVNVIEGFIAGTDKVSLLGGVGVASTAVIAGSARVMLTDGTSLTLVGVTNTARLFG